MSNDPNIPEIVGTPTGNNDPSMQAATIQNPTTLTQRPSTFRNILSTGLISLGAGLSGHPEAAATLIGQRNQRQFAINQDVRDQQRLEIQQRESARQDEMLPLQKQREQSLTHSADSQAALALIQKLKIEKETDMLPAQEQRAVSETFARINNLYLERGFRPVVELDDTPDVRHKFLQQMHLDDKALTHYIFQPDPIKGKIMVFQRDDQTRIDADLAKDLTLTVRNLTRDPKFNIPVGAPFGVVDNLISHAVQQHTSLAVASIQASQREAAIKPLTTKDALAQARQEIGQIVNAEELMPTDRRQFKSAEDIQRGVDKRTQELLDLDGQLRRGGIDQLDRRQNTIGMLSQLQTLRQHGSTDADLKQHIVSEAVAGRLSEQEIMVIYDKLGLSPSSTEAKPSQAGKYAEAGARFLLGNHLVNKAKGALANAQDAAGGSE